MTELNELYHFGIKGQRWGVRRFQNADGTLTSDGRKRYRAYKNDLKEYNKINRHVAASQKHLKEEGVMLNRVRDVYEKKNKDYQKEMAKSSGFLGLKAAEKSERVARAQANADEASGEYSKALSSYGVAKKIAKKDTKELVDKANNIIRSYGKGSIKDIEYKTVKIGQNKLQKLMQGAPLSSVLGRNRDTDKFVKTGMTLADMPVIGNMYTAKYIANEEFKMKTAGVENKVSDSRQLAGKKSAKFVGRYNEQTGEYEPTKYFNGYSSLSPETRKQYDKQLKEAAEKRAEAKKAAKKEAKEKKEQAKAEKEQAKAEKKANREKASKYVDNTREAINNARSEAEASKRSAQREADLARQITKGSKKYAREQRRGSTIKSKLAGAAISVIGAGATAAAGPIAGYAARVAIKRHKKKKRQEAWDNFWGIKHSATYRVARSDELYHHGIKGQRWGVRRYRNPDGTLNARGKKRKEKLYAKAEKEYEKGLKSKYWNRVDPNNSEFQKNLLALKKKEIDAGLDYYEHRIKKNAIVGQLIGGIPGAAIGVAYSATKYRNQYDDRRRLMSTDRKIELARQETARQMQLMQQEINRQTMERQMHEQMQQQIRMQQQMQQQMHRASMGF